MLSFSLSVVLRGENDVVQPKPVYYLGREGVNDNRLAPAILIMDRRQLKLHLHGHKVALRPLFKPAPVGLVLLQLRIRSPGLLRVVANRNRFLYNARAHPT
jgi:hypothetical protein